MKLSKFSKMSSVELEAHRPRTQDECEALTVELDFRTWCKENDEDPESEDSREHYQIAQRENAMNKKRLKALEKEVNAELCEMAKAEKSLHEPITDGVVDIDRYLSSSPKILWILKEPWERLEEGQGGGGWSVTQGLIPKLISEGKIRGNPTYRKMAYVTFSIFNNFVPYSKMPYPTDDPRIADSLMNIACINVNKFPGKPVSHGPTIELYHRRNREILKKQVATINPDVVIAGNTLHLFCDDFRFKRQDLKPAGSTEYHCQDGRLYVNAFHPSYWGCKEEPYVNDLVAVIKKHRPSRPGSAVNN